jgi:hypothetical protein
VVDGGKMRKISFYAHFMSQKFGKRHKILYLCKQESSIMDYSKSIYNGKE